MKTYTLVEPGPKLGYDIISKYVIKGKPNNLISIVPYYGGSVKAMKSKGLRVAYVAVNNGKKTYTADFTKIGDCVITNDGERYVLMTRQHYERITNPEPIVLVGS